MTCRCPEPRKPEWRAQPNWNRGRDLYGYGVRVLVIPHYGKCPLCDEVLAAEAIRVA